MDTECPHEYYGLLYVYVRSQDLQLHTYAMRASSVGISFARNESMYLSKAKESQGGNMIFIGVDTDEKQWFLAERSRTDQKHGGDFPKI